jgi:hypothetical protein
MIVCDTAGLSEPACFVGVSPALTSNGYICGAPPALMSHGCRCVRHRRPQRTGVCRWSAACPNEQRRVITITTTTTIATAMSSTPVTATNTHTVTTTTMTAVVYTATALAVVMVTAVVTTMTSDVAENIRHQRHGQSPSTRAWTITSDT